MTAISTLLIANRGEIACRVMRTARALGLRTVAVYSQADAGAPHVAMSDAAVCIGDGPVGESYLAMDKIIGAARATGADAIHPGYGFLSENAGFARACADAGLIFVGPPADAIAAMGNKAEAKRLMKSAGVPCVPGYEEPDQSDERFMAAADTIGSPVMVKAAAGGGGRGMRLVTRADDLPHALAAARSEALNAFGSDELILEKAVMRPRHVEVQVFADRHGTIVHLGERDCSVQRRHQKVVEEAPCPVMTPELREGMGAAAVEAARAIGYVGAGTVEFLLDDSGAFYFLEMNTRLQVEHPVTELVTGLDLVALQIRVAEGHRLGFGQDDVALAGHAIEARLYAEDPAADFLPQTGKVSVWRAPEGEGVRVDSGIVEGQAISPFYDPMLAKIIAGGPDRETARKRLVRALRETVIHGVATNRDFLIDVLETPDFAEGAATTAFIGENFPAERLALQAPDGITLAAIAVADFLDRQGACQARAVNVPKALLGWSSMGGIATPFTYESTGATLHVTVRAQGRDRFRVVHGETHHDAVLCGSERGMPVIDVGGLRMAVGLWRGPGRAIEADIGGRLYRLSDVQGVGEAALAGNAGGRVTAPMHGRVLEIFVATGEDVAAGQRVAVVEAMKMQHEIAAPVAGTVVEVAVVAGAQVAADDLLLEIEERGEG